MQVYRVGDEGKREPIDLGQYQRGRRLTDPQGRELLERPAREPISRAEWVGIAALVLAVWIGTAIGWFAHSIRH